MLNRFFSGAMTTVAIAAASAVISATISPTGAQGPAVTGHGLKTPWGEPDLQGIWTDEFDTPFQRPAKYANQEYFTEAQRQEMDKNRSSLLSNDERQEAAHSAVLEPSAGRGWLAAGDAALALDPLSARDCLILCSLGSPLAKPLTAIYQAPSMHSSGTSE